MVSFLLSLLLSFSSVFGIAPNQSATVEADATEELTEEPSSEPEVVLNGYVDGLYYKDNELQTGWQTVDGHKMFFSKYGFATGRQEIDNTSYYFDENGYLYTGWVDDKYFTEDGLAEDTSFNADGYYYEVDETGACTYKTLDYLQLVVQAALNEVGNTHTCTQLVNKALESIGYYDKAGSWWLSQEATPISADELLPGDIAVYTHHVSVYIGNGEAVHGGWYGSQTVVSTLEAQDGQVILGYYRLADNR
jgi:hypothetical protein